VIQIEIEVVETVSSKEQDKWGPVNIDQVETLKIKSHFSTKMQLGHSILAT